MSATVISMSDLQTAADHAVQANIKNARASALAALRNHPDHAHLTVCERSGGVEAAKNLRKDLKKHFPGIKFSVRADYSSINVKWVDGPTRGMVEAIANRYQCGTFNGMEDIYEFSNSPFTTLFGGAQYVFCFRELSDELEAATFERLRRRYTNAPTLEDYKRGNLWQFDDYRYTVQQALANAGHEEPEESEQESEPATEQAGAIETAIQASLVEQAEMAPAPIRIKPKFTALRVGGGWSVTVQQGEYRRQFDGIEATSLADACRLAWAMFTEPTPPGDDPSGLPLPAAPTAEQTDQVEQGAQAPTRAERPGNYAQRVETKRERLEVRAIQANQASDRHWIASRAVIGALPLGQPILVGHHSERRHRRAIEQSHSQMRQSVAQSEQAERLSNRAASVGHAGIASDDPEALDKLREALAKREQKQQAMKEANKARRGTYRAWQLGNNNAEIRRLRQRIATLQQLHQAVPIELAGAGWRMSEEEGRVLVVFDGKPADDIRQLCKRAGFVWSPRRAAWVRKVTVQAVRAAKRLAGMLPRH